MEETLDRVSASGYSPCVVIDAGANRGLWTRLARPRFPSARFHVIEPQPCCQPWLRALGDVELHACAVSTPGVREVRLIGSGTTGAWVDESREPRRDGILVPARTLDELVTVTREDRALLKLDLEGHEMAALAGASALLDRLELVLSEVPFFDERGRPCVGEMHRFLDQRGFLLYDVASLSPRRRDGRLRQADLLFARRDSPLLRDQAWT
jgi:FkbM family methyltransferase